MSSDLQNKTMILSSTSFQFPELHISSEMKLPQECLNNNSNNSQYSRLTTKNWTKDEDNKLIALVVKFGPTRWKSKSQHFPRKTPKQCAYRWYKVLVKKLYHSQVQSQSKITNVCGICRDRIKQHLKKKLIERIISLKARLHRNME